MSRKIKIGGLTLGGDSPIVVQTMCNTHTSDVEASVAQCIDLYEHGAQMIRLTVPGLKEVEDLKAIRAALRANGIDIPLVADVHFSSDIAIACAAVVEKVRINPGNFHKDHERAREQFRRLTQVCKQHGTVLRIGLNHGSLGERITNLYGNTPVAMKEAAMEWLRMCRECAFDDVVVSLKASNTIVMVEAYRLLADAMQVEGMDYPMHLGVTEAGNGDSGRIKSAVGISALLSRGIGDTIRVSLTEDPACELPVAQYIADRYDGLTASSMAAVEISGRKVVATYHAPSREALLLDYACDWGRRLLDREIDEVELHGDYLGADGQVCSLDDCPASDAPLSDDPASPSAVSAAPASDASVSDIPASDAGTGTVSGCAAGTVPGRKFAEYLQDELLQACRRRFYRPEYVACPGCGRTMYNLEETFNEVKRRTAHLKDVVIAIMGCIVNGPGEMADADWGYVGEGNHKVSIYHKQTPVLRHVPESEAIDKLLELMESDRNQR